MREIYRSSVKRSTNCGGPDQEFERVLYVVEKSDVGKAHEHYLGYNQRPHTIVDADVGSVAVRYMREGYVMWHFMR